MQKFQILTVVWGAEYTSTFLQVCLPSLLSPGNLVYLGRYSQSIFQIYTTITDAQGIRESQAYDSLKDIMPVEIIYLEDIANDASTVISDRYEAMSAYHAHAVRGAQEHGRAIILVTPDTVWAEGSFTSVHNIAQGGKKAILFLGGLRLLKETFIPDFLARYGESGRLQPISARQLVELALDHLHPETRSWIWDSPDSHFWPLFLLWRVDQEGLVSRSFSPGPIMISPTQSHIMPVNAFDYDYAVQAVPNLDDIYVVQDSDELCFFELSPEYPGSGNIIFRHKTSSEIATWAKHNMFRGHLDLFRYKARIHIGDVSEQAWLGVERESDRVADEILSSIGGYAYRPPGSATLSVILASHNHGNCIGGALEAILSQSFKAIEVLAVDDASIDGSISTIERFTCQDPSVRLLQNEQPVGPPRSLRRASEQVSGDYLYIADAGGGVVSGFFERTMGLLAEYPQAGLCCSNPNLFGYQVAFNNEPPDLNLDQPRYFLPEELTGLIGRGGRISNHTYIIRRSALLEAGGIRPELGDYSGWFAWLVVALRGGICYMPEVLQVLRKSPRSYSQLRIEVGGAYASPLEDPLSIWQEPQYADVRPYLEDPGIMGTFGFELLHAILRNPDRWPYVSSSLVQAIFREEGYSVTVPTELDAMSPGDRVSFCRRNLKDFATNVVRQYADNLRAQNDWYAAIYWYFRALDADPTLAEAYSDLGDLFRRQKRFDKAALCEQKRNAV